MSDTHGVTLVVGKSIFDNTPPVIQPEKVEEWKAYYRRALAGESLTIEDGTSWQYSLSPFLEKGEVIGATVIAQRNMPPTGDPEPDELQDKIAEMRLMTLRSIMSQHFIFNVLSSIQFFMGKGDQVNAIHYLSVFSRFIRGVLTHALKSTVSLSDEITMLKSYVELEMARFEGKFEFILEIDPAIDLNATRVPSLLTQPLAESAVQRCLYNPGGNGRLSIRIKNTAGAVVFEIEDNGIGRDEVLKLTPHHTSGARPSESRVADEHLKLIREQSQAYCHTVDLFENGVPSGTRVIVRVPG